MTNRFTTAEAAKAFILAGNSTVTFVSLKTGTRFTYRIRANEDGKAHFISLLSGPDNDADYRYLGRLDAHGRLWIGRKVPKPGDIGPDASSALAFAYVWERLCRGVMSEALGIWHEGRCGRCNRKLTVPTSIESGIGPECERKMAAEWIE